MKAWKEPTAGSGKNQRTRQNLEWHGQGLLHVKNGHMRRRITKPHSVSVKLELRKPRSRLYFQEIEKHTNEEKREIPRGTIPAQEKSKKRNKLINKTGQITITAKIKERREGPLAKKNEQDEGTSRKARAPERKKPRQRSYARQKLVETVDMWAPWGRSTPPMPE